jgi:hypothetical protein
MPSEKAHPKNKRAHPRLETRLLARYLLPNGHEAKGVVTDVSLGGIALAASEPGKIGETVILYIDDIGRVEGTIVRLLKEGFALKLGGTAWVTERVGRRLQELHAKETASRTGPERRKEPRVEVAAALAEGSALDTPDGGAIVDLSLSGAHLKLIGPRPPIGAIIPIGPLHGRVVRHSTVGVAVEFVNGGGTETLTDRIAQLVPRRK